jgi:hypothetical protein
VVPLSLGFRLMVFLLIWWYLTDTRTVEQQEMATLQFRIQQYRRAAEYFGSKVIKCENRYAKLAEQNRMN